MNGSQKVYVIEPGKEKSRVDMTLPPIGSSQEGATGSDMGQMAAQGNDETASGGRTADRSSGLPLLLAYCAGPLGIFATSRGRRSRPWIITALATAAAIIAASRLWGPVVSATVSGSRDAVVLLLLAGFAVIAGFSLWTHSILIIGRHEGARVRRIPDLFKRPAGTGILGLVMPGLGLFISGRSRQAAAALWMISAGLLSVGILLQADWLWRFNREAGLLAVDGRTLEYVFMACAACALMGIVTWIVQALNGVNHSVRGDGGAVATRTASVIVVLCVVSAAGAYLFERTSLADRLDHTSADLQGEGFEIAPLVMAETAMRLDPSQPRYALRVIELYENAGMDGSARILRRSLVGRLEPCIDVLEDEGLVARVAARPGRPAGAAGDRADIEKPLIPAEMTPLQDPLPVNP